MRLGRERPGLVRGHGGKGLNMNEQREHAQWLDLFLFDGGAASAGGAGAQGAAGASGEATGGSADTGAETGEQVVMDAAKARREEFERLIGTDYKDLYAEKTQKLIDRRFKQTKELEDKDRKLRPILERLSAKYGESDPDKLLAALDDDDSYYEQEAVDRGMTVEQLKQFKKIERENEAFRRAAEEQQRQEGARETYSQWMQQADALKETYPDFDLQAECQNDTFLQLLQNNIDMQTAYEVIHRDDVIRQTLAGAVQKTRESVVRDIQARGMRPTENGLASTAAAVTKTDVNRMTKAEREEIERRVLRGERIVL